jgi:AcrR family transcriptional regulator
VARTRLAPAAVVAAGAALADEVGYDHLTMGLLAQRVGVRAPSLYKHIGSLDALQRGIANQARGELGEALTRAAVGRAGPDAVRAYAGAWRLWAFEHPGCYAATVRAPTADADDGEHRSADDSLRSMYDVLAGFGLNRLWATNAARMLRSALHGFVILENSGGFGLRRDLDRSFNFLLDTVISGLLAGRSVRTHEGAA